MTNQYTSLIENEASRKIILCRVTPTRCMNDLLTDAGLYYTSTLSPRLNVYDCKRNGSSLTKVASNEVPTNPDEWGLSGSTFMVALTSAPSSVNIITIDYDLFFTNHSGIDLARTPTANVTGIDDIFHYDNRITNSPIFSESTENILDGLLSLSASQIELNNADKFFSDYVTDDDSYYNKPVDIWFAIDSTENIRYAFSGFCSSLKFNGTRAYIGLIDKLFGLEQPAGAAYYNENFITGYKALTGITAVIDPNKFGNPIRKHYGTHSGYQKISGGWAKSTDQVASKTVDIESLYEATCGDFDDTASGTVNRTWFGGYGSSAFASSSTVDYVEVTEGVTTIQTGLTFYDSDDAYMIEVGDALELDVGGTKYYCIVEDLFDRSMIFCTIARTAAGAALSGSGSCSVASRAIPCVMIENMEDTATNKTYNVCLQAYQYTCADSTNLYSRIILNNNFETAIGGYTMNYVNPSNNRVMYRTHTSSRVNGKLDSENAIMIIKGLIEGYNTQITADTTSFNTIADELPYRASFSIPFKDEDDFNPFSKYIQELLQSTCTMLYVTDDLNLGIKRIQTPVASNTVFEHNVVEACSTQLDYRDIITKIISYNPYFPDRLGTTGLSNVTLSDYRAEYLHGTQKTIRFRHLLENISQILPDIFKFRRNRKLINEFSVDSSFNTSKLGDDVYLDGIDGTAKSGTVKIISIDKSNKQNNIITLDLMEK